MKAIAVAVLLTTSACHLAGEYGTTGHAVDVGDTNGRSFDLVSSKPAGDEWTIRLRGSSLWAAYSTADQSHDLGAIRLTSQEVDTLWDLIERVDIAKRRRGLPDNDGGTILLRLREPPAASDGNAIVMAGREQHALFTAYVAHDANDHDVVALATKLQELVERYKHERPSL